MFRATLRTLLSIVLASQLSLVMAGQPVIGVAVANGNFHLDAARVTGNGTLFEGSTMTTGQASGQLRLTDGVRMQLASNSQGTVYRDRLILTRGTGRLENARGYKIDAMGLRVFSDDPAATAQVEVDRGNQVQVAALGGTFRVTDENGIVLAVLPAGRMLAFDASKASAASPTAVAGCVLEREGHYFLADEATGLTFELSGDGLANKVGHKLEVTGSAVPSVEPAEGASQVIRVSRLKELSGNCSSKAAAAAAVGAGAAPAGAAAGVGGATTAVIAGVVVAVAGTGAAVGLTRGSDEERTISR